MQQSIKHLEKDEFVGYATSYRTPKNMTIVALPLGYSNGYPRTLSNKGEVLISKFSNAINNELVSRLPNAVPRVAVK